MSPTKETVEKREIDILFPLKALTVWSHEVSPPLHLLRLLS